MSLLFLIIASTTTVFILFLIHHCETDKVISDGAWVGVDFLLAVNLLWVKAGTTACEVPYLP